MMPFVIFCAIAVPPRSPLRKMRLETETEPVREARDRTHPVSGSPPDQNTPYSPRTNGG